MALPLGELDADRRPERAIYYMLKENTMIVSTKGRYALRVMIDLAEHRSEKYVPLKEVAARQEISEKYL